jgi:diguanylate cyclase (GGDEF)-like protein
MLNVLMQNRGIEAEESLQAENMVLENLVGLDALTGVPNRRAFDQRIELEFRATRRSGQPLSLLMIDVDFFKLLNDASGHVTGDIYLRNIAQALRNNLPRATDLAARYGGEEFVVILGATGKVGAITVAERLRQAVSDLHLVHPSSPFGRITISVGGSTIDGPTPSSPLELIGSADQALYRAKALGRDRTEM